VTPADKVRQVFLSGSSTIFVLPSNVVLTHWNKQLNNNGLKPHRREEKSFLQKLSKNFLSLGVNYQLLYPAMLVALLGLLVPLLIHLWNRRRGRVVLFGSTQFLEATQRKKVSRLSFSQPLLFLLRALMIVACVLLLTEPVRVSIAQILPQKNPNWLLIHPSLLERNDWQNAIDTTRYRGYEQRVLARGFSLVNENNDNTAIAENRSQNIWSLLADAAAHTQAPDSIALYFTPQLNDFQGIAPTLPTHITWHEIPAKNDTHHILRAWQTSDDKLALIIGKSNEEQSVFERFIFGEKEVIQIDNLPDIIIEKNERLVYFKNKKNTAVSIENTPKLNAIIFYDNSFRKDRNYLVAALKSISEYTDIQINIKKERIESDGLNFNLNEAADAVFYLSEKPLNDSIIRQANFRLFVYKKNQLFREDVIVETFAEGKKTYTLTRRLTDAETTTKLPQKLLETLLTPNDFDQQSAQFDQRKIAASQYKVNVTRASSSQDKGNEEKLVKEKRITGFHAALWWILLGLFLVERTVANSTSTSTSISTSTSTSNKNLPKAN